MTDPSKTDPTRLCPGCFRVELPEGTCERCGFDRAQASSPTTLPVGAVLAGKYLIGRVLGSPGGFGITYLGWNLHLQTRVAIKEFMPRDLVARSNSRYEIVPHTGDDHESFVYGLGKFLEEARTLAKFDHRNVVQVSDYFEENGTAYLVMKYYDGAPLSDYVAAQGGTIPLDVAVQIFLPVLDALEDVHARGFLHRDIKPSNIYLTDKGRPILLDFGASRQAMSERSRSLSAVLTPGYAPFEQYHRRGRQGPWTDIYACAATFYRVVVGVAPPEANSRMAGEELRAPHEVVEGMSRSMSEGILRALEVRAADRLQTVAELEDVLRDRWDPSAPRAPQGAWAEAEGTGSGHARPGSADTPDASSHSGPARQPGSADADTQPVGAGAAAWNDPTRPVNRAAGSVPFDATRPLHGAGGPPAGGSGGGDDGGKGDDAGGGAGWGSRLRKYGPLGAAAAVVVIGLASLLGPRSGDDLALLQQSLRDFAAAQEDRYAEHLAYTGDLAAVGFTPDPAVIVRVLEATAEGWAAAAWKGHKTRTTRCIMKAGAITQPLPAWANGSAADIVCDETTADGLERHALLVSTDYQADVEVAATGSDHAVSLGSIEVGDRLTVPAAPGRWSVYATQSGGSISWGDTFEVAGSTEVDIRLADRIAARDDAARRDRERRRADSIAEVRRRRRADSIARARRADSIAEAERGRTSSAARRIVFSETGDRFSGERIWDESDNAACERLYSGGRYILRSKAEGSFCASYLTSLGDVSGPVRIEAVTHLASGPTNQQLGIIFGHQGNSYFVAGMSGNGSFKLARRNADGSWTDVLTWQGADAAHSGRGVDNHHAVEIRGRRIDYFLNGSFVNAFEAGRSLEGGVGLYNNGNLMEVRYDDFKISNIEADDRATRMRRTFYSPSGETFEGERFWSTTWSGSAASNCSSEYTAGGFVMRSRTEGRACLTWLSRLGSLSGPLTIKGTVSLRNGPLNRHYGIRVAISDGDYIVAGINGNGSVRLARWTGSQWVYPTDWERNSAVRTGLNARNELEVRIDGRRMTFYVNGTQVQTATIDRDLVGGIGLYVGSQMEVLYDNLRVTKR